MRCAVQSLDLRANEFIRITTPHGVVLVDALMGTNVSVYENPLHNPVGIIRLRDRTPRKPVDADEFFRRLDEAVDG